MSLIIEYTNKKISPYGGVVLLKEMFERIGLSQELERISLPKQGSNRGYNPQQLIINFIVGVISGANKFDHLEVTRQDKVIQEIFEWTRMPGHRAYQRYFEKFTQAINQKVFREFNSWFFKEIKFDNYTLDLDSTIITRYGSQQGAKRGYNPKKRGRSSHHPLLAFIPEVKMCANIWLRSGNTSSSNNFYGFIEDTFERLKHKKIGLLRADSGFFDNKIMNYLENKDRPINYIISTKFYSSLKRAIVSQKSYYPIAEGIEISETKFSCIDWEKERRLIIVRQQIDRRPKAIGRQLRLFGDDEVEYRNYRYSCYITNLDLPAKMVWDLYRNRADSENRIKELKEDFGIDSFNVQNFFATEAALNFVIIAYNLISLFRQIVMKLKIEAQLKTLRYKVFGIGSYIVKNGNKKILKLALDMKRRKWFEGLWANSKVSGWPFVVDL